MLAAKRQASGVVSAGTALHPPTTQKGRQQQQRQEDKGEGRGERREQDERMFLAQALTASLKASPASALVLFCVVFLRGSVFPPPSLGGPRPSTMYSSLVPTYFHPYRGLAPAPPLQHLRPPIPPLTHHPFPVPPPPPPTFEHPNWWTEPSIIAGHTNPGQPPQRMVPSDVSHGRTAPHCDDASERVVTIVRGDHDWTWLRWLWW